MRDVVSCDPVRSSIGRYGGRFKNQSAVDLGIALEHPVGATGGRLLVSLSREKRRREARFRLKTMCSGGGEGMAAVFERLA